MQKMNWKKTTREEEPVKTKMEKLRIVKFKYLRFITSKNGTTKQ